jgi:8-oxo-dGTP diphosphatase
MAKNMSVSVPVIKAASACVWRGDAVLLVERGNELGQGHWSLPGGKVEDGETALQAAIRELREETGITAILSHHVGEFEISTIKALYVISCFTGHHASGTALAQSDARALAWVPYQEIANHRLAPNTQTAVLRARTITNT